MDLIFIFIILIAIIVLFLDCWHMKPNPIENFTSRISNTMSNLSGNVAGFKGLTNTTISPNQLKNAGIYGSTPPMPDCNITELGGNCTNYPYSTALDKYQPVCQRSTSIYPYGDANFKIPLYVMAKQIGRTRQCKNLFDPA